MRTIVYMCFALLIPGSVLAGDVSAGLQSTLWFSKDPLPIGETVEIYAMIYNSDPYALNGEILLRHGTTTLDTKPFTVGGGGKSVVVAFPYLVTPGTHTFTAMLQKVVLMSPDSSMRTISPVLTTTQTEVRKETAIAVVRATSTLSQIASSSPVGVAKGAATAISEMASSGVNRIESEVEEVRTQVATHPVARVIKQSTPVLGSIEDFRVDQSAAARTRISSVTAQMPQPKVTASSSAPTDWSYISEGVSKGAVWKSPFQYVELFLLMLWEFLTKHPWVFYVLLLGLCFKIIRVVLQSLF